MASRSQNRGSSPPQDWRSIQQRAPQRPASAELRWRQMRAGLKALAGGLTAMLLLAGLGYGGYLLYQHRPEVVLSNKSEPVSKVIFATDGTLTDAWLDRLVGLPLGQPLLEVDIVQLKQRIEATPQVRHASVQRRFPDKLSITLEERQPLAQIRAAIDGQERRLLVARDGVIYAGFNYAPERLGRLPWLGGLRLQRAAGGGFRPVRGIEHVAELLAALRAEAPGLAQTVRVVDCSGFMPEAPESLGSVLAVRSAVVPEIVFRPGDYARQIERLRGVLLALDDADATLARNVNVDLSYSDRAVVQPLAEWSRQHGLR